MNSNAIAPHVEPSLHLLDGLDRIFGQGMARLSPHELAPLTDLAHAHHQSPLGGVLKDALQAVENQQVNAHHLAAIAAGRESLWGAIHDALYAQAVETLKLSPAPDLPEQAGPWLASLDSAREALSINLVEMALAGFRQIDSALLEPAFATLEPLQRDPSTERLAILATGFFNELLAASPTNLLEQVPLRRWMDLWARTLLACVAPPTQTPASEVDGLFHALGAELRQHENVISLVVHGVFEAADTRTFARIVTTHWRVETIGGLETWKLFVEKTPNLVALAQKPASVAVTGKLHAHGLLSVAQMGIQNPLDLTKLSLEGVVLPRSSPRDRHPIHLAIPVQGDLGLPLAWARMPSTHALDEALPVLTGLLRWDETWQVQPLTQAKGKKVWGMAPSDKIKGDAVAILRERAGKLLRQ